MQVVRIKEMIKKHKKSMFVQNLPTNTIRNMWRTLRRICIFILGLKLKGELVPLSRITKV